MSAAGVQSTTLPVSHPPSPGSSISLLETVEDTRLVLEAFLQKSLHIAVTQRPGRVGGAYRDTFKFSIGKRESRRRADNGWDSTDEQISVAEEKKHGFKDLIRKRLRYRHTHTPQHSTKESLKADSEHNQLQDGSLARDVRQGLSELEVSGRSNSFGLAQLKHEKHEQGVVTPSSSSDEAGIDRKDKKKKKKKSKPFSSFFRKTKSSKELDNENCHPKRPNSLSFREGLETPPTAVSPSHNPQFYNDVAQTLDRIAQKRTVIGPAQHLPGHLQTENNEKDAMVRQLVQVLSMEGDAINDKIQSDPFLRSSLARLSYTSFAKLLDTFAYQTEAPVAAPASPTLSRVAVTMEVSRRVITATGTQRMRGYAEKYMGKFVPWVQSQGGWEKIVRLEDLSEYD